MSCNIFSSNTTTAVNPSTVNTTNVANSSTSGINIPISNTDTNDTTTTEWSEQTIRLLIDQRKNRNREYYLIIGRSRKRYWDSIARRVNRAAGSDFTGNQCKKKFNSLVSRYYVSKLVLI